MVQMNIVIVDDSPLVRETIREIVEDENDEIFEFSDGESVIKFLRQNVIQPDWILLDIKMNGINGFEIAALIKLINPKWHFGFITNYNLTVV